MLKNTIALVFFAVVIIAVAINFDGLVTYGQLQQVRQHAEHAVKTKNWKKAVSLYAKGVQEYPDNMLVLEELGQYYIKAGEWRKAEYCFRTVLKKIPVKHSALLSLADVCQQDPMRVNDSIALLRQAFHLNPANIEVLNRLGWLYFQDASSRQGEAMALAPWIFKQSKYYYEASLKQKPEQFKVLFQLAAIEQHLHHRRLAAAAYCKSLALQPHNIQARYNLSLLLQGLEYYNEAYSQMNAAITQLEKKNRINAAQRLKMQAQSLKNRLDLPGYQHRKSPAFLPSVCLLSTKK